MFSQISKATFKPKKHCHQHKYVATKHFTMVGKKYILLSLSNSRVGDNTP